LSTSALLKERFGEIKQYYADDASTYDEDRFGGQSGRLYDLAHYSTLVDMLRAGLGKDSGNKPRVLDIATGTGRTSTKLAKEGYEVVGLDLTAEMLHQAMQKQEGTVRANFIQGNAFSLPFATDSFDAAMCCRMLQMIPLEHYLKFGEEVGRILKPGGLMIVEVWNWRYRKVRHWSKVQPNTQGILDTFITPNQRKQLFGDKRRYEDVAGLGYPLVLRALGPLSARLGLGVYRALSRNALSKCWGETLIVCYRNQ